MATIYGKFLAGKEAESAEGRESSLSPPKTNLHNVKTGKTSLWIEAVYDNKKRPITIDGHRSLLFHRPAYPTATASPQTLTITLKRRLITY